MARRPAFLRVIDIGRAVAEVMSAVDGLDFRDYRATRGVRSRVERELEIISEASRHLAAEIKLRHADIPWQRVADFETGPATAMTASTMRWSGILSQDNCR